MIKSSVYFEKVYFSEIFPFCSSNHLVALSCRKFYNKQPLCQKWSCVARLTTEALWEEWCLANKNSFIVHVMENILFRQICTFVNPSEVKSRHIKRFMTWIDIFPFNLSSSVCCSLPLTFSSSLLCSGVCARTCVCAYVLVFAHLQDLESTVPSTTWHKHTLR